MNVTAILFAALIVGGVGILIGFFLGISGEKFKVCLLYTSPSPRDRG